MDLDGLRWVGKDLDGLKRTQMDWVGLRDKYGFAQIEMDLGGLRSIQRNVDGCGETQAVDGLTWIFTDLDGF